MKCASQENPDVTFGRIKCGEPFVFEGKPYLKIHPVNELMGDDNVVSINAVNLATGHTRTIEHGKMVTPKPQARVLLDPDSSEAQWRYFDGEEEKPLATARSERIPIDSAKNALGHPYAEWLGELLVTGDIECVEDLQGMTVRDLMESLSSTRAKVEPFAEAVNTKFGISMLGIVPLADEVRIRRMSPKHRGIARQLFHLGYIRRGEDMKDMTLEDLMTRLDLTRAVAKGFAASVARHFGVTIPD